MAGYILDYLHTKLRYNIEMCDYPIGSDFGATKRPLLESVGLTAKLFCLLSYTDKLRIIALKSPFFYNFNIKKVPLYKSPANKKG